MGIRYCGGCNPRYDRVGLVRTLQAENPEIEFKNAENGTEYDAVLVVCGCLAQCADHATLQGRLGKLVMGATDKLKDVKALLQTVKES